MFLDPRALFMLVILVGVTGFVAKNLMVSWYKLNKGDRPQGDYANDMEERLRRIEAATSSLLVDVSGIKEKQRFMARLQAGAAPKEPTPVPAEKRGEGDLSPMMTQSIPVMPRAGYPRN